MTDCQQEADRNETLALPRQNNKVICMLLNSIGTYLLTSWAAQQEEIAFVVPACHNVFRNQMLAQRGMATRFKLSPSIFESSFKK